MEFWEGAVLIVGGLWVVGRMSRNSANHPVNNVQVNQTVVTRLPQIAQSSQPSIETGTHAGGGLVSGTSDLAPIVPNNFSSSPIATPMPTPVNGRPISGPISTARPVMTRYTIPFTAGCKGCRPQVIASRGRLLEL